MSARRCSRIGLALTALTALLAAGCGSSDTSATSATSGTSGTSGAPEASSATSAVPPPPTLRAVAALEGRSGSAITGTASFVQGAGARTVQVRVRVEHATPGRHGLHVHEKGDCSSPTATSAGDHLNPASAPHAGPETEARHAGDLGNIEIREDGSGDLVLTTDLLTVAPGTASVVGRSVVFHAGVDDLTTQPAGASGARQGCGVVRAQTS